MTNRRWWMVIPALLAPPILIVALLGGLVRLGVGIAPQPSVVAHGALLVSGFFGTVIGTERAVAIGAWPAFITPALAAVGAIALLGGAPIIAYGLWLASAIALTAITLVLVVRQPEAHLIWLTVAGAAWVGYALALLLGAPAFAAAPAGLGFLALTIFAERLELSRLRPRPRWVRVAFTVLAGAFTLGIGAVVASSILGDFDLWRASLRVMGAASVGLGLWMVRWDIVSLTVRRRGLARYTAVALIGGYVWLVVAGTIWALGGPIWPGLGAHDAALHALAVGFVLSMVLGHAPIILPAVSGLSVRYSPAMYVPLLLLHATILVRVLASATFGLRAAAAVGTVLALVGFAALMVRGVLLGRARPAPGA